MIKLAKKFFKIHRSITGSGVRKSLNLLKREIPSLKIKKVRSGTRVFDWIVPPEWNIKDAFVADEQGNKLIDFQKNNLHIINYSTKINKFVSKKELLNHLFFLKDKPNSIPYITSYYKKFWGFCLSYKEFKKKFNINKFKVVIKSNFKKKGFLNYGELIIKGKTKKEILIYTYICHPSLANNETSGPIVCAYIAKYFSKKNNFFTLRFVFAPETIGAITYLKINQDYLKKNIIGGYVITCVGDEKNYSFLESKEKKTISNIVAKETFKKLKIKYKNYNFLERGSDERQFNSPGINLPIASIMRTKYGEYPEYHTSDDNLKLITDKGLKDSFRLIKEVINNFNKKIIPTSANKCEPFLSKRKLYPTISTGKIDQFYKNLLNFLSYADGTKDLDEIGKKIKLKGEHLKQIYNILKKERLIT